MYKSFRQCCENLANVTTTDYHFAKEIAAEMKLKDSKNNELLFYLLMLLMSVYMRGYSCLKMSWIADKTFFNSDEEEKNGFTFPSQQELENFLSSIITENKPIYYTKEYQSLYINRLWTFEKEIADFLKKRIIADTAFSKDEIKNVIDSLFSLESEINWQKVAVINSLIRRFSIISGGPGTGKTTTVAKLLLAEQMLNQNKQKIALLAPTGKAAQRLTESLENSIKTFKDKQSSQALSINTSFYDEIALKGQTIHRFLGLRPNSTYTKYNEKTKAPYDVVVVDEASMLDINIFIKLIRAVGENTKLILIGDVNQLPSVEAGSLLSSLTTGIKNEFNAESLAIIQHCVEGLSQSQTRCFDYTVKLIKNYRSEQNINTLANDILENKFDKNKYISEKINFYTGDELDNQLRIFADKYKQLATKENYSQALAELKRFRILVANKNLDIGTNKLNQKIEKLLNKKNDTNYKAKPIMITQNNYSLGLFNGDVGIIWPDRNGKLKAYFEGKEDKEYSLNMLSNYESVYAMTIHKTQGSEFDEIAIILPKEKNQVLTRELLYTGITRAKSKLAIISADDVLKEVINSSILRMSNISNLLKV